jgi:hypothetical protein
MVLIEAWYGPTIVYSFSTWKKHVVIPLSSPYEDSL